jgi:primosomal protein N' (replication factor Y)
MPILRVALDVPLDRLFDYRAADATAADLGRRVRVPFGRQRKIGVIMAVIDEAQSTVAAAQLKEVEAVLRGEDGDGAGLGAALPDDWRALCQFAAAYYQEPIGEAVAQALPPGLKQVAEKKTRKPRRALVADCKKSRPTPLALTPEQAHAVDAVSAGFGRFSPFLLHGVTGSGKTEVYLRLIEVALARSEGRGQALLLVPEINLTPQLETRVSAHFPDVLTVGLHSELGEAARTRHWQAAADGSARIILGTRLSIFTPLPALELIIVDEEHDASFKQQDGMRYSARDLAVFRAHQRGVPIVLGSATPALESWANAESGRYTRLSMVERAVAAAELPLIRLIDTRKEKLQEGLSAALLAAIELRLERGEQSLVFLNRRGYAPVLACAACGWISGCRRCAANLVVHLADRRLRCHHCGFEAHLPRACPTCGNQDIHPFGRGTQRLEAHLIERFPGARVLRVDRDSTRSRKQWEIVSARIHAGEADILVGTQMLAKGHDFPNLTLVGATGADAALFAADWRAPERLFAQLMQVAGRAGRAQLAGEVLVQTEHPEHPLFDALIHHDYPRFAKSQLKEREEAGFPPYSFQAMLRAEAPQMADSVAFLLAARAWKQSLPEAAAAAHREVVLYDAVPMKLARLANLERAQLLVESGSRLALQRFLSAWRPALEGIKAPAKLRWHLEVDPIEC